MRKTETCTIRSCLTWVFPTRISYLGGPVRCFNGCTSMFCDLFWYVSRHPWHNRPSLLPSRLLSFLYALQTEREMLIGLYPSCNHTTMISIYSANGKYNGILVTCLQAAILISFSYKTTCITWCYSRTIVFQTFNINKCDERTDEYKNQTICSQNVSRKT